MATIQIQNPTDTISVQQQSVQSIQTSLRAVISTILRRRKCLPRKSFKKRDVLPHTQGKLTTPVAMLERDRGFRSNVFLDWLEGPALHALENGELRGLQICVHPESHIRQNVIETYTFGIWYESATGTLPAAAELQSLIQTVDNYCAKLPELPSVRFMSVNLLLKSDSQLAFPLPTFEELEKDTLVFPRAPTLRKHSKSFHSVTSAFHRTSLRITSMVPSGDKAAHLHYPQQKDTQTPVDGDLEHMITHPPSQFVAVSRCQTVVQPLIGTTTVDLQAGIDTSPPPNFTQRATEALRAMRLPEAPTQGDTQSSTPGQTFKRHGVEYAKFKDLVRLKWNDKKAFRFENEDVNVVRRQSAQLAQEIGGKMSSGESILCICGYPGMEGDMIQCECCHTYQHLHCHGFIGQSDPRRPDRHYCYLCTINKNDTGASDGLLAISLSRRALFFILREGCGRIMEFSTSLHVTTEVSRELLDRFKADGNTVAAHGANKEGYKKSGKPTVVPAMGDAYKKTLDQYFDPTTHMEAYYQPDHVKPSSISDILVFPDTKELPRGVVPLAVRQANKEKEIQQHRQTQEEKKRSAQTSGGRPKRKSARHTTQSTASTQQKHLMLESLDILDVSNPGSQPAATQPATAQLHTPSSAEQ